MFEELLVDSQAWQEYDLIVANKYQRLQSSNLPTGLIDVQEIIPSVED